MPDRAPTPPDPGHSSPTDEIAALCPNCGLCCNGVLFADVGLRRGDDASGLARLGFDLERRGRRTCFDQPCHAFDGTHCRVYEHRPGRCRGFECELLRKTSAGEMPASAALQVIRATRERATRVVSLLRALGNADEARPLVRRYADVMGQPTDLAQVSAARNRGALLREMGVLMETAHREFLDAD